MAKIKMSIIAFGTISAIMILQWLKTPNFVAKVSAAKRIGLEKLIIPLL